MTKEKKPDLRPVSGGTLHAPDATRQTLKGNRFVFTAAQNNTDVHEGFLASLLQYCAINNAQLIVSPFTYNKNGFQNSQKDDSLWYDPAIRDKLTDQDTFVTPWQDLVFCGSLNILPTAVRPLSGLNNYCRSASGIIPHTKVQMQSLPRMNGSDPRFLYTTGAVTKRNYIKKKAGQKAEFHHVFGALLVEVDEESGEWFARQLIAGNDGCFQDLNDLYTPTGVKSNVDVEAIQWGDVHAEKTDKDISAVSWDRFNDGYVHGTILDTLRPSWQFVHDLTDFAARNHHNINDPHFLAQKHFQGASSVLDDIVQSACILNDMERDWCQTIVVDSNHDHALDVWLKTAHKTIVRDPENAWIFHHLNAWIMGNISEDPHGKYNVYAHAIRDLTQDKCPDAVIFLEEDESFVICPESGGIECGLHGHRGPNGARGTPNNLNNIGSKLNTGHTHSAGILDGVYTAGVSAELDMGYNKGPSSWSHSHIVTYKTGKRAIITLKNGKWRA